MQTMPDIYEVTENHDGADSSDVYEHTSIVETLRDMIIIGQSENFDEEPISWTLRFKSGKEMEEWVDFVLDRVGGEPL